MNTLHVLMWAVLGLAVGATLAPTAARLAAVPDRRLYRLVIAMTTTVTCAVLAHRYSVTPAMVALTVFGSVGVLLGTVDVLVQRLPRTLVWPTCAAVAALFATEEIGDGADMCRLSRAAVGAIALVGGYLGVALASRGGLGAGDVRAAFLVGGVLGWHGWSALLAGTVLGFLATGAISAAWCRRRTTIPHGPGMLAGAFAALLL
ncbi:hypothetical protein [Actinophytocola sp. NPDC049390]|uniref:hypothetical protein n=1 Tax=Actinophytocola sp. NPDC049390 TaxID=3363894 RepID=UPI003791599B